MQRTQITMAPIKRKFKTGTKVKILPNGGKGIITSSLRKPGNLYYSYRIKYKQRKNSKILWHWFSERSLKAI